MQVTIGMLWFSREAGWAGISFGKDDWRKCAIARAYPRDVAFLSEGHLERMFYFPQQPTDLAIHEQDLTCMLVANGPEV